MRNRSLTTYIKKLALSRNKMVFLSGPRQAGKTTLSKILAPHSQNYFNWDFVQFRKRWIKGSEQIAEEVLNEKNPIIILDEFHKNKKWKNQLKGFFDQYGTLIKIIVTGSARLNLFRKGADSLMGRFIHFHLLPYSFGEIENAEPMSFSDWIHFMQQPKVNKLSEKSFLNIDRLFKFGGFPEAFENENEEFQKIWQKNRFELLIRQDLRELTPIFDIGQVELLASYLPDRVGSPLSTQSLREDLDVAHTTVTRWLAALSLVYYQFEVRPFATSIPRSLKKEPKIYLYDWSVVELEGPRFENMIACHLLKMIHFYNDTGQADLKLHYLRDKDGHEVDFLITNKNKPLFSIEAKLSDLKLDKNFQRFQKKTKAPHFQIIKDKNFIRKFDEGSYVISFDQFFHSLP